MDRVYIAPLGTTLGMNRIHALLAEAHRTSTNKGD